MDGQLQDHIGDTQHEGFLDSNDDDDGNVCGR
jgi:hypothetical protein